MLTVLANELAATLGTDFVALYLVGSYETTQQLPCSDVDLILVLRKQYESQQLQSIWHVRDVYRQRLGLRIDIIPRNLETVLKNGVSLKQEGRLITGTDIRPQIKIPSNEKRSQRYIDAALMFVRQIHQIESVDLKHLQYPNEYDQYYGYPDYTASLPLSRLMSLSFLASARLAKAHHVFITNKHDLPYLYQDYFTDESGQFVQSLFRDIRGQWHYQIPVCSPDQHQLTIICKSALPFVQRLVKTLL